MPIYAYKCAACGFRKDVLKPLREINRWEHCEGPCFGYPMQRQVTSARINPDYPGYDCPITGKWIEGRRAHAENLKRHGMRVFESGEHEQNLARRAQEEAQIDSAVDSTVEEFVTKLDGESREALATAVSGGAELTIERK